MDERVLEHLREVLLEGLEHTGAMLPLLFAVFLLVEAVSHRTRESWLARATGQPILGPIFASILGLLPQCGFSVAATMLYLAGLIPAGSLLAAYISTSDEALPILLANRSSLPFVVPLIVTKFVWGAVVGISVNLATARLGRLPDTDTTEGLPADFERPAESGDFCMCGSGRARRHSNKAGREVDSCIGGKATFLDMASHALNRTARTLAMVFVLSCLLNFAGHMLGENLIRGLTGLGFWQPLVAALIGLIPSCATSVAVAEAFLSGMMSFPATLSALTSNAGIGVLVLLKESRNKGAVLSILGLLVLSAFLVGILATILLPSPAFTIYR
ncbi:MAG: arsenic efflux protein [Candidatus Fermentithermobacillus carboniphilus]|uniref:Arsenic efflux protein n=1 Tax=Candidatus Fermentithermobacillus carboniphilus TaxID=3085328 RepID=A0AAT9LEJ6_9FIRM|nr:MAG: arsenic efflux protein [Candidatus Fermentithermobacillus carboniphilus]